MRTNREHLLRPMSAFLLLLLLLIATGCSDYSSQAEKYFTQARAQVLGAAYTLERFGEGEVSGTFVRTSLQQYAKAMQKTGQSLEGLKPPPTARPRHERAVQALSRAQKLVQEKGKQGIKPNEASGLANSLEGFAKELRKP